MSVRLWLKSSKLGFSITRTKNFWMFELGFRKDRETRDQIANICWITVKSREFQKNIHFCFVDCDKTFDCVDHNKLWKTLTKMGIPDHLTCLPGALISSCNLSSLAFRMMCSVYKLNKQGDNKQSSRTPFSILNQVFVPYRVLTIASWPTYRFLRRQVRWSGIPIFVRVFHSLLWSTQSKVITNVPLGLPRWH